MRFFFRRKQGRRPSPAPVDTRRASGDGSVFVEKQGYDPYETLDDAGPSDPGMRRRRSGKFSF